MNGSCTFLVHVGLPIFSFQVVLFTSGDPPYLPALPASRAPGTSSLVNKSWKSSCKTHVFLLEKLLIAAIFRRFWKFLEIFIYYQLKSGSHRAVSCAFKASRVLLQLKNSYKAAIFSQFSPLCEKFSHFSSAFCVNSLHIAHASAQLTKVSRVPTWAEEFFRNP